MNPPPLPIYGSKYLVEDPDHPPQLKEFKSGECRLTDPIPSAWQFILSFIYITPYDPIILTLKVYAPRSELGRLSSRTGERLPSRTRSRNASADRQTVTE